MYSKEIVKAICANHLYEYCIVSSHFEVIKVSDEMSKYCDKSLFSLKKIELFDLVPELVGMDKELVSILEGSLEELMIPMVFKAPHNYINIRVHPNKSFNTFIVLFENVTENTTSQYALRQANNDNLLLLDEIETKNQQLEAFNKEMQNLVDKEVAKNLEKQHMIELQTRHAQMGEMIAMITHQWKQPLSVIQTVCTLLKIKYDLGKVTKELFTEKIDNILTQTTYMTQTVNDFQKFFTPSKKKALFNVKETISSVLHLVEMEYALENIKITLEGKDDVFVEGYANEYNQVILAILHNAKDALVENKKTQQAKQISIEVGSVQTSSHVTINDTAGGIPESLLEKIFTQYMTTKEKGSGLGLHIAKTVIEKNMGGKLEVSNRKEGACFSILV